MSLYRIIPICLTLLLGVLHPAAAQHNDFREAEELIREQQYEEALNIVRELYLEYPDSRIYFEQLVDLLIRTERFDQALQVTRLHNRQSGSGFETRILEGEIHHRKGQREEALEVWSTLMEENPQNLSLYFQLGSTLISRREFGEAESLYRQGRERFGEPTLFSNELFSVYMQQGDFSAAVGEYIHQVRVNPGRGRAIRQRLSRMQDPRMLDEAIGRIRLELEETEAETEAHHALHELLFSLLVETESYEEAVRAASEYDRNSPVTRTALFEIAGQLAYSGAYRWAIEAYRHYLDSSDRSLRREALDRIGTLYRNWGLELQSRGYPDTHTGHEHFRTAYERTVELIREEPGYANRTDALIRAVTLSLDLGKEDRILMQWYNRLQEEDSDEIEARADYHQITGRIHLRHSEWREARFAFSRARHTADRRDLQERSRYFLAITDFLAGDPEFARLQLSVLERQYDSRYANDALRVRLWIQESDQMDETSGIPERFRNYLAALFNRNVEPLENLLNELRDTAFEPHALLEAIRLDAPLEESDLYSRVDDYNRRADDSPLREQLLWYQAVIGHRLLEQEQDSMITREMLMEIYETIVNEYPSGLHTPHARRQLQDLEEEKTS